MKFRPAAKLGRPRLSAPTQVGIITLTEQTGYGIVAAKEISHDRDR